MPLRVRNHCLSTVPSVRVGHASFPDESTFGFPWKFLSKSLCSEPCIASCFERYFVPSHRHHKVPCVNSNLHMYIYICLFSLLSRAYPYTWHPGPFPDPARVLLCPSASSCLLLCCLVLWPPVASCGLLWVLVFSL